LLSENLKIKEMGLQGYVSEELSEYPRGLLRMDSHGLEMMKIETSRSLDL
jgi:hypothetical protein